MEAMMQSLNSVEHSDAALVLAVRRQQALAYESSYGSSRRSSIDNSREAQEQVVPSPASPARWGPAAQAVDLDLGLDQGPGLVYRKSSNDTGVTRGGSGGGGYQGDISLPADRDSCGDSLQTWRGLRHAAPTPGEEQQQQQQQQQQRSPGHAEPGNGDDGGTRGRLSFEATRRLSQAAPPDNASARVSHWVTAAASPARVTPTRRPPPRRTDVPEYRHAKGATHSGKGCGRIVADADLLEFTRWQNAAPQPETSDGRASGTVVGLEGFSLAVVTHNPTLGGSPTLMRGGAGGGTHVVAVTTRGGRGVVWQLQALGAAYSRGWWAMVHWLDRQLPIISPNTNAKRSWDVFMMLLVVYTAVAVPLAVSYGLPSTEIFDYLTDFMFAIDIVCSFRTAFIVQGVLVRDADRIALNYLSFWFPIDLVATIPYDALVRLVALSNRDVTRHLTVLQFAKTPRLLRLGRLYRILRNVRNAVVFKVVGLVLLMMLIAHWLACLWYLLFLYSDYQGRWSFDTLHDGSHLTYYLSAYYYSFMLLVGNNFTAANDYERLFFIFSLIMGAFLFSVLLGAMAMLVVTMNTTSLRLRQKEVMTQDVLRYIGAPPKECARSRVSLGCRCAAHGRVGEAGQPDFCAVILVRTQLC